MSGKPFRDVKNLGDDNVYVWREEMRCGMVIERLSKWLTQEPREGNMEEEEASERCWAFLYMSLGPRWQREVNSRARMSASALWSFLIVTAVRELLPHELAYTTELNSLKQKSEQSITEYLEEAEKISVKLQIINRPVDTRTLVLRVVQGLSRPYDAVRDNLVLYSEQYDTISKLRTALLALEVSKTDQGSPELHCGLAARHQQRNIFGRSETRASGSGTGGSKVAGEFSFNCNHCGQPGNKWFDCQLRINELPAQPKAYAPGFPGRAS